MGAKSQRSSDKGKDGVQAVFLIAVKPSGQQLFSIGKGRKSLWHH